MEMRANLCIQGAQGDQRPVVLFLLLTVCRRPCAEEDSGAARVRRPSPDAGAETFLRTSRCALTKIERASSAWALTATLSSRTFGSPNIPAPPPLPSRVIWWYVGMPISIIPINTDTDGTGLIFTLDECNLTVPAETTHCSIACMLAYFGRGRGVR